MQPSKYELYRLYFKKERLIFANLNKCILRGNFIDGEVWIPQDKFEVWLDIIVECTRECESNRKK